MAPRRHAPLVAVAERRDPIGPRIQALFREDPGDLIVPSAVTAEAHDLLGRRVGRIARRAFLEDPASGTFTVTCLDADDHAVVIALEQQYADLDVGLADLSVVVVARRYATRRVLTFDERHFRAMAPLDGGALPVLPSDADRT